MCEPVEGKISATNRRSEAFVDVWGGEREETYVLHARIAILEKVDAFLSSVDDYATHEAYCSCYLNEIRPLTCLKRVKAAVHHRAPNQVYTL